MFAPPGYPKTTSTPSRTRHSHKISAPVFFIYSPLISTVDSQSIDLLERPLINTAPVSALVTKYEYRFNHLDVILDLNGGNAASRLWISASLKRTSSLRAAKSICDDIPGFESAAIGPPAAASGET